MDLGASGATYPMVLKYPQLWRRAIALERRQDPSAAGIDVPRAMEEIAAFIEEYRTAHADLIAGPKRSTGKGVPVRDLRTGKTYPNISIAADETGMPGHLIYESVKTGQALKRRMYGTLETIEISFERA